MGQQNRYYAGPISDVEPQQVHHRPESCMVSHNGHTMLPSSGNITAFGPRNLPENQGQLPHVNPQYNGERGNTSMGPSPSAGLVSVPVNHDHVPVPNDQVIERNRSVFMDGSTGLSKRSGSSVTVPMTSEGNRATGSVGFDFDPVAVHNRNRLVRGGQAVRAVPQGLLWNRAPRVRSVQDTRLHGYQVAGTSRNSPPFMHPRLIPQGSHCVYQPPVLPPPPPHMDIHLQLPSTSHSHSTGTSSTYPFHNDADPGPGFVGPGLPHGVMAYQARQQPVMENAVDLVARHSSLPRFRALSEEALLAFNERIQQISNLDSGLSDSFISDHLKTRTFASVRHHSEDLMPADEKPNFCVICQMEFEDQEKIGMLDCFHEYHEECIKKWLLVKNNCPICKSAALH
ncbi:hypothetical protein SSX86_006228 [Deinandra increscens subsp. villosa]|uniref:RING-type E3 ubiquitin transferase n=1 Tax=Deinandra increscens subsp. villosa TaxID=3103831 RepID=A0AAP0DMM3_9ASTR